MEKTKKSILLFINFNKAVDSRTNFVKKDPNDYKKDDLEINDKKYLISLIMSFDLIG